MITHKTAAITTISKNIRISKIPDEMNFENLYACEDEARSGFSSSFNILQVKEEILEAQPDTKVDFINHEGNIIPEYQLENYRNSQAEKEEITIEISSSFNNSCKTTISLDLIVQNKPELATIQDVYACEGDFAGYGGFDLTGLLQNISNQYPNCSVKLFNTEDVEIEIPEDKLITNSEPYNETIILRLIDNSSFCYDQQEFNLNVREKPLAYALDDITACDDNGDGIAENFDVSMVVNKVKGDQKKIKMLLFMRLVDL